MKPAQVLIIGVCVLTLTLILWVNKSRMSSSSTKPDIVRPMDEAVFWEIISNFNWKVQDEELIMKPAVNILSKFPIEDIHKFDGILSEKLYLLDGEPFGSNFMRGPAKYLSVDMFLYRRCYVVARGKDFF